MLALAAIAALVWANSPAAHAYESLWQLQLGVRFESYEFVRPLHFWINDGLMTAFFFMVGLEIRWEMHEGSLSSPRRAALPVVAALGGMVVPALVFLAFNRRTATAPGWGIPIATDIAFAVGVLTVLGKRVPPPLRVFLLALAIIDDIGAILVIAIFYSSHFSFVGFATAAGGTLLAYTLRKLGARSAALYAGPAIAIWVGLLVAGIHPTLAGVVLGFLTPVRAWYGKQGFAATARAVADDVERASDELQVVALLHKAHTARREAVPPAIALRARLHSAVSFGILPLFALANAGIAIGDATIETREGLLTALGVVAGLVVGKPVGVVLASVVAVKARLAVLPAGISWREMLLVGIVAGIGFTMAIFIAHLAFQDEALLATAKLAVLVASLAAAVLGVTAGLLGWTSLPKW